MIEFLKKEMRRNMNDLPQKIEAFFKLATLGDSENSTLLPQAKQHGFSDFKQWESQMQNELDWLKNHSKIVRLNLAPLRKNWPHCCSALEEVLISNEGQQ